MESLNISKVVSVHDKYVVEFVAVGGLDLVGELAIQHQTDNPYKDTVPMDG
jgi:hypothetical protein